MGLKEVGLWIFLCGRVEEEEEREEVGFRFGWVVEMVEEEEEEDSNER